MNQEELISTLTKNPQAQASSSRIRATGGTVYFKDLENKTYYPLLSHHGNFIVNFQFDPWRIGIATKTRNMLGDFTRRLRNNWLMCISAKSPTDAEPDPHKPVVEINMGFSDQYLKFYEPPAPSATRLLLMGVHPSGTQREEWSANPPEDPEMAYQKGFQSVVENNLRQLAYNAIRRENAASKMAMTVSSMKQNLDIALDGMVSHIEERLATHFQPTEEEAGLGEPYLQEVTKKLNLVSSQAKSLEEAARVMGVGCSAPDSVPIEPYQTNLEWDWKVPRVMGDTKSSSWVRSIDLTDKFGYAAHASIGGHPFLTLQFRNITFYDLNARSYSYYWFRRNFDFYKSIFQRMNCFISAPFGQYPSEWKYEELAAPLFAED